MKKFALIGASGYIAPRHLEAIRATENSLVAAFDVHDSVGILDRYFPKCKFFGDEDAFRSFLKNNSIDYLSICSPNYKHFAQIQLGLVNGCDVICEKPLVLTEEESLKLIDLETLHKKCVYTILQLREHPAILALKEKIKNSPEKVYDINLKYITPRGDWYHKSWKGDVTKSGGLSTNIGIHFFDMLSWIFGDVSSIELIYRTPTSEMGTLSFKSANVNWLLSIDSNDLPDKNSTTYRSLLIDGEEFEFTSGFTDLHTVVYNRILQGNGHGIKHAINGIKIAETIRKKYELF